MLSVKQDSIKYYFWVWYNLSGIELRSYGLLTNSLLILLD